MQQRTQRFVDALWHLESSADAGPVAALFADGATLSNPLVKHQGEGKPGAHAFWSGYRASFGTIASTFRHIVDGEDAALLEWTSEGTLKDRPVRYGGVSVLEFGASGITAFRTYFDTRQLEVEL